MRFNFRPVSCAVLLTALATPAWAQDALDRIEPTAGARDRVPPAPPPPRPKVQVDVDAPVSVAPAGDRSFLVGAVTLKGLQTLSPADFADILVSRVGQRLTPDELADLAGAIARRARERGLPFASAWIGAQTLANGVLSVSVDEGRIDEVRLDGPDQPAVRRALAPLVSGRPARLDEVERRLLIAGDIQGVLIVGSRYAREKDRGVLIVRLLVDRVAARVIATNDGSRPVGPAQVRIDVDLSAIFAADDAFTVTYSTVPNQPREMQYGRARYSKRLTRDGTEVAVVGSSSLTHPGAYLSSLGIRSKSWYVGAEILQPLWRRRATSLWLQGEFGLRDLQQWRSGTLARHDRIAAGRVSLYGSTKFAGGRLRINSTLSQGFGILDATRAGDPLASRRDADGTFTSFSAWTDWTRDLGSDLSLRLAMQSQLATEPLLIAEETGLGGTGFLRGYDWSERTGDQGAMGMAELRYDWNKPLGLIRSMQLYGFVDGGEVSNLRGGFGSGALASAGGGIRADIVRGTGANFELAVPLTGPRYDTDSAAPQVNLRLMQTF